MATTLQENGFHALMAGLTLGSLFLEEVLVDNVPGWNPPQIGLLTLVLAWIWLARVGAFRLGNADDRIRVLVDRIERLERGQRAIEDEQLRRGPGRLGPPPSGVS